MVQNLCPKMTPTKSQERCRVVRGLDKGGHHRPCFRGLQEMVQNRQAGVTLQRHLDRRSPNKDSIPSKSWL